MSEPEESFDEATPVVPFSARPLPAAEDAEEQVIGCCLIDEGLSFDRAVASGLNLESFTTPRYRMMFALMKRMRADKKDISVPSVTVELAAQEMLAAFGGPMQLVELTREGTTAHAGYMIEKVREKQILRETIIAAGRTIEEAYAFTGGLAEFLNQARLRLPNPEQIGGANGSAYTVWQPADFRAYQPPLNMNILGGGYLRLRQLTTLIGPPGVGKSRLSLWLACLQVAGPFAGLETRWETDTKDKPVDLRWLFFGNENDPMRQKSDLSWFYRNLTAAEQARVDANLFLHVVEKADDGIITLADPEAYQKLRRSLKHVKPDVVVFDPWGNMIEGNENDNEEVRRTLKLLIRAISENCPDAAILVIHHARTGKATAIEAGNNYSGGNLGRGSKALVSSARCELALWPGDSEDSTKLVLTCEKANNVQKFEPKGLIFENGIYREDSTFRLQEWRDDIEGKRGGKTLSIKDVVDLVRRGCFRTSDIVNQAEAQFGVGRRTIQSRLAQAVTGGYLEKTMPAGSYTLGSKVGRVEVQEEIKDHGEP